MVTGTEALASNARCWVTCLPGCMIGAGAGPSRSFSYANAGATADNAMADAKAIVMIFFTVRLRCLLMQDGCLAGAACDANARHTQVVNTSQNPAFRSRKCHGRSGAQKK